MNTDLFKLSSTQRALALSSLLLLLSASGCLTSEDEEVMASAFEVQAPAYVPPPDVAASCYADRHSQPPAEITKKIDILFLTDTSSSLNEERQGIAQGIDAFVAALPADVDYRIGVMMAHGSKSTHTGRLRKRGTEPRVLDSQALTLDQVRSHLLYKLSSMPSDNYSDGGEEGLYSLWRALDEDKLVESRAAGFYREDAALAVIFIADEQDICADYPANVTPVVDTNNSEGPAKIRDCTGITPASVLNKLKTFQGDRPLLVGGIIYSDHATYARVGENEFGYGYYEMLQLANGVAVDLATGDYATGLSLIGSLATIKLNLNTEFPLSVNENIDVSTIQVSVDGNPTPFTYLADSHSVAPMSVGTALSVVDIQYCQNAPAGSDRVSALCQAGSFEPQATIKVGLSIDPNEGSMTSIVNGFTALGYPPIVYSDAEIVAGKPTLDGVTVLLISRKVILTSVSSDYVSGVYQFIEDGGSVVGELDGAALFFNTFQGANWTIPNMTPAFEMFTGIVDGGGALLPLEQSRTYVTDPYDPIMNGLPADFLDGLHYGYAITGYDGEWLHSSANFISSGWANEVPAGTYPAVLSGRCGKGRVALYSMDYFQYLSSTPVKRMVTNTLQWVTGQ